MTEQLDNESTLFVTQIAEEERNRAYRVPGVRTVLVVLSGGGLVFDTEALLQQILQSYPDAAVFFLTPSGKPIGPGAPEHIDLLVDFTGPGQREKCWHAKKLRRMARIAVGRHAGWLRSRIYDRIFDEQAESAKLPDEMLAHERIVQRKVLGLAGVVFLPTGAAGPDRGAITPRELPPLKEYSRS